MSVGFALLVISPFLGGASLFGSNDGRGATQELLDDSREKVREDNCSDTKKPPTGKRLARCQEAFTELGSAYQTLAAPITNSDGTQEAAKDFQRNIDRATDAYKASYELDPTDVKSAERYAGFLQGQGKAALALPIWTALVKAEPNNEDYLLNLATAHQGNGDTDKAIATFNAFLKKFPESGSVDGVKEEIENIKEQEAQAAAGGGNVSLPPGLG
ncbi:MAG: Tetratricopeptide repeat, partial [Thermoleophilia bacterium]|nr:Tetratricopeptide repeat [Thermoleophilia bacterium]